MTCFNFRDLQVWQDLKARKVSPVSPAWKAYLDPKVTRVTQVLRVQEATKEIVVKWGEPSLSF